MNQSLRQWFGSGKISGSFYAILDQGAVSHQMFAVWTTGTVQIEFGWMVEHPPFDSEERRIELLDRLNSIPGVVIGKERITTYPRFPLAALTDHEALGQFLTIFEWFIDQVKAGVPGIDFAS